MTYIDWLVLAWIGLSTICYFVSILYLAPKLSAVRWQKHFEEEDSAQESLLRILMGKNDDGVIPIIVGACGEVVTENLKKSMQGYQGKSMQMLEKAFDPDGLTAVNKELDEYPFYVRLILQKVLEKYGGSLANVPLPTGTDMVETGGQLGKLGIDSP